MIVEIKTRIDLSFNFIKLYKPKEKAKIPERPAKIPGMARSQLSENEFPPSWSNPTNIDRIRIDNMKMTIKPIDHFPSLVAGINFAIINILRLIS